MSTPQRYVKAEEFEALKGDRDALEDALEIAEARMKEHAADAQLAQARIKELEADLARLSDAVQGIERATDRRWRSRIEKLADEWDQLGARPGTNPAVAMVLGAQVGLFRSLLSGPEALERREANERFAIDRA